MKTISVIIPVYNVEKFICRALDSVINQTLKDIEIICADDNSSDNSLKILNEYAKKDERIKIITSERHLGPGIARNRALDAAKGKYIMFLDADDWLDTRACELCYEQIEKNNNDFVLFGYNLYNEKSKVTEPSNEMLAPFDAVKDNSEIRLFKDVSGKFIVSCFAWAFIYRKAFLDKFNIRFAELFNAEDIPFVVKTYMCADTISVTDMTLYTHTQRENSTTKCMLGNYNAYIEARKIAYESVKKYAKGSLYDAFLIYHITSSINWLFRQNNFYIFILYYLQIRNQFKRLSKSHDIEKLKNFINYKKFKRITDYPIFMYVPVEFIRYLLRLIFSTQKSKTHKIFNILGIKIKFKRQNKYKNFT